MPRSQCSRPRATPEPGPTSCEVVQAVIPAGTRFGKSVIRGFTRGFALSDWNSFSPWLPAYRISTAEFLVSSRSKPKLQLWILSGPKLGAMEVSAKVRGSKTPGVMEEATDARTLGPVGTTGNGWVFGAGRFCRNTSGAE